MGSLAEKPKAKSQIKDSNQNNRANKEKKQVILAQNDITVLREAIIKRYEERTLQVIENPIKFFNSNLKNYDELFNDINEKETVGLKGRLEALGITGKKPLALLFHFSRNSQFITLKRTWVNALYQYAFGCEFEEYLKSNNGTISAVSKKRLDQV